MSAKHLLDSTRFPKAAFTLYEKLHKTGKLTGKGMLGLQKRCCLNAACDWSRELVQ